LYYFIVDNDYSLSSSEIREDYSWQTASPLTLGCSKASRDFSFFRLSNKATNREG